MKIEQGKVYRRKSDGYKMIALEVSEGAGKGYWRAYILDRDDLPPNLSYELILEEEVEEWKEPLTVLKYVWLHTNGHTSTHHRYPDKADLLCESEIVGVSKVSVTEGVFEK